MDNFSFIYRILRTLEAAMDYPEFDFSVISPEALGVSRERWGRYIEMMTDSGLVKGASIRRDVLGNSIIDIKGLRITLEGLEYLSENSIMQRRYKAAKGLAALIP